MTAGAVAGPESNGEENLMEHADIVEVLEVRLKGANDYLAHGYRLLSVEGVTAMLQNPESKTWYVKRQVAYVVGRPSGVVLYQPGVGRGKAQQKVLA